MSGVWVGQIACSKDDCGLDESQQTADDLVVLLSNRIFSFAMSAIKGQFKTINIVWIQSKGAYCNFGLTVSDVLLNSHVELSAAVLFALWSESALCIFKNAIIFSYKSSTVLQFWQVPEVLCGEIFQKIEIFLGIVIEHSICSWCHIRYMDFMALIFEFFHGSAHWNHIIIRMRREDKHFFLNCSLFGYRCKL